MTSNGPAHPLSNARVRVVVATVIVLQAFGIARAQGVATGQPAQSFEGMAAQVRPGRRLIIHLRDGRTVRGPLESVSGQALVLNELRAFRRTVSTAFAESDISHVELRDSTLNGLLIGLGIGSAAALGGCAAHQGPNDMTCAAYLLAVPVGVVLGQTIDALINRRIFSAPAGATAGVAPLLEPRRVGLVARVSF